MPYFSPEVVHQVKQIDLLTYLKTYEPYELVKFSAAPTPPEPTIA